MELQNTETKKGFSLMVLVLLVLIIATVIFLLFKHQDNKKEMASFPTPTYSPCPSVNNPVGILYATDHYALQELISTWSITSLGIEKLISGHPKNLELPNSVFGDGNNNWILHIATDDPSKYILVLIHYDYGNKSFSILDSIDNTNISAAEAQWDLKHYTQFSKQTSHYVLNECNGYVYDPLAHIN